MGLQTLMPTIYTIGHSTKKAEELIEKLNANGVKILVDVRSKPYSRWNPQWNIKNIEASCKAHGIDYRWRGANLGGLGENVMYEETIDELVEGVERGDMMAVMCSEGDYHNCHRHSMLEPDFVARGLEVFHIEWSAPKEKSVDAVPSLSRVQTALF